MARVVILENKLEDEVTPNVPDGAGTVIVRVEVDGEITEQYFMPTLETAEAKKTELEG
jgi:hypothetical protein